MIVIRGLGSTSDTESSRTLPVSLPAASPPGLPWVRALPSYTLQSFSGKFSAMRWSP